MSRRLYQEGESFLHRFNPVYKFALFSIVIMIPTVFMDPFTPAAFLVLALVTGWGLGGISPLVLARRLRPVFVFTIALIVYNILFYGGARSTLLGSLGPIRVYAESVSFGLSIGLRVLSSVAFSALFAFTTDPTRLASSLVHQARFPYRLGYTVLAAYRFLPILQRELNNIRDAHSVRGAYTEHDRTAGLQRARRYGVPLLANGIRQAERLAVAMDARGFGALPERTYYVESRATRADRLFVAGYLAMALLILAAFAYLGLLRFQVWWPSAV